MAERGAHLTYTTLTKPSIFELIAQESLSSTIQPAFKRIAEVVAESNPERYGWLSRWFDEIYSTLNSFLQYHYLSQYGGSLSEIFYGLCRVSLTKQTEDPLKRKGQLLSLLQLILVPYVRHKLEQIINDWRYEAAEGMPTWSKSKQQYVLVLLKLHNYLHITWETVVLSYYILYLGGRVRSHSPLLQAMGLAIRYSEEDLQSDWDSVSQRWFSPKQLGKGVLRILEVGAFCLQFLQWWQAEEYTINFTTLPVPKPPPVYPEGKRFINRCPLCNKNWKIETLLPVSGYIFCYRCIVHYLRENKKCPVTGCPASDVDLVRIFR